jgi:flavin-dependent dehydrogenase
VGDAAALADTTLAGGISDALWSGRVAAQVVKAWLDQGAGLSEYGRLVWERYLLPYYLSSSSKDPRDQSFWLSTSL